jgi:hypothetical protein
MLSQRRTSLQSGAPAPSTALVLRSLQSAQAGAAPALDNSGPYCLPLASPVAPQAAHLPVCSTVKWPQALQGSLR